MTKMAWDKFVKKHGTGICIVAARLPWEKRVVKGVAPDGRMMPTAYSLLGASLDEVFKGDWSIRSEPKIIHVVLADDSDRQLMQQMGFAMGKKSPSPMPAPCSEVWQFVYEPEHFASMAKMLGYTK